MIGNFLGQEMNSCYLHELASPCQSEAFSCHAAPVLDRTQAVFSPLMFALSRTLRSSNNLHVLVKRETQRQGSSAGLLGDGETKILTQEEHAYEEQRTLRQVQMQFESQT